MVALSLLRQCVDLLWTTIIRILGLPFGSDTYIELRGLPASTDCLLSETLFQSEFGSEMTSPHSETFNQAWQAAAKGSYSDAQEKWSELLKNPAFSNSIVLHNNLAYVIYRLADQEMDPNEKTKLKQEAQTLMRRIDVLRQGILRFIQSEEVKVFRIVDNNRTLILG